MFKKKKKKKKYPLEKKKRRFNEFKFIDMFQGSPLCPKYSIGRDARGKGYGDICICIHFDSPCCKAETNTPL